MSTEWIVGVSYGVGIIGMAGFVFGFFRFSNYKETVQLQNDNIKALQDRDDLQQQEIDKLKTENKSLQLTIQEVKTIPLKEISMHMEKTNKALELIIKAGGKNV